MEGHRQKWATVPATKLNNCISCCREGVQIEHHTHLDSRPILLDRR